MYILLKPMQYYCPKHTLYNNQLLPWVGCQIFREGEMLNLQEIRLDCPGGKVKSNLKELEWDLGLENYFSG